MPQPIDPITELGRMTAAERIQQIADRASLAAQARHTETAANQLVAAETQVPETLQKGDEVNEELRRKVPFTGRRKRKKEEQDTEDSARTFYTGDEKKGVADDPGIHDLDVSV